MNRYKPYIILAALLGAGGCTSLSEGQENLPARATVNERVTLYNNPAETVQQRMNQQASEINRKRNIEQFDSNSPAMTPNTLRPRQLPYAPIDSSRHNLVWPVPPPQPTPPPPPRGTGNQ